MKVIAPLMLAVLLTGCGQSEAPPNTSIPSVEELASDPARLKALREQCKTNRAKLGDVLCNRVAEATNLRFFGDGKVPYTPPASSPKF
ncbi:EexN family lipoprotein [Paucibacter sp. PLA-PC-4]|uniref:EexN family lipoprotein n=1 Tax=Paucibacter sp. PLA-PC-4 TaxID=2993655 RepID=UPI00224B8AA9|nr:EexN family lipoprotein [Paucibacter sp. PLA-PC-4]MCX2864148.1 EexN family lipoprotein [Paucibacter sp. PLA-PC-4]